MVGTLPPSLFELRRTFLPTLRTRATSPTVIIREGGRPSIPETLMIESKGRGVLDPPHARGMTAGDVRASERCDLASRRLRHHAVAAVVLGAVERGVGALEDIADRLALDLQRRQPD
jgi:hypothetical protein